MRLPDQWRRLQRRQARLSHLITPTAAPALQRWRPWLIHRAVASCAPSSPCAAQTRPPGGQDLPRQRQARQPRRHRLHQASTSTGLAPLATSPPCCPTPSRRPRGYPPGAQRHLFPRSPGAATPAGGPARRPRPGSGARTAPGSRRSCRDLRPPWRCSGSRARRSMPPPDQRRRALWSPGAPPAPWSPPGRTSTSVRSGSGPAEAGGVVVSDAICAFMQPPMPPRIPQDGGGLSGSGIVCACAGGAATGLQPSARLARTLVRRPGARSSRTAPCKACIGARAQAACAAPPLESPTCVYVVAAAAWSRSRTSAFLIFLRPCSPDGSCSRTWCVPTCSVRSATSGSPANAEDLRLIGTLSAREWTSRRWWKNGRRCVHAFQDPGGPALLVERRQGRSLRRLREGERMDRISWRARPGGRLSRLHPLAWDQGTTGASASTAPSAPNKAGGRVADHGPAPSSVGPMRCTPSRSTCRRDGEFRAVCASARRHAPSLDRSLGSSACRNAVLDLRRAGQARIRARSWRCARPARPAARPIDPRRCCASGTWKKSVPLRRLHPSSGTARARGAGASAAMGLPTTIGQVYFAEAHACVVHVARFDRNHWSTGSTPRPTRPC